jgi:hypothetical protein
VAYLARILEAANSALEGLDKQAFMTELDTPNFSYTEKELYFHLRLTERSIHIITVFN